MTLNELIEELIDLRDGTQAVDGETEVRLATQPHYPLQHGIAGVVLQDTNDDDIRETQEEIDSGDLDEEDLERAEAHLEELRAKSKALIYLTEGSLRDYDESPYASKSLWDR